MTPPNSAITVRIERFGKKPATFGRRLSHEEADQKETDEEEAEGYHFKFNVAVILRADQKTQVETLSKGVSNFIYTPNEARAFLDLEAKPGGDKLLGNGASIPVEYTGAQYINNFEGEEGKLYKWIQKTIKEALEKTLQKD